MRGIPVFEPSSILISVAGPGRERWSRILHFWFFDAKNDFHHTLRRRSLLGLRPSTQSSVIFNANQPMIKLNLGLSEEKKYR